MYGDWRKSGDGQEEYRRYRYLADRDAEGDGDKQAQTEGMQDHQAEDDLIGHYSGRRMFIM